MIRLLCLANPGLRDDAVVPVRYDETEALAQATRHTRARVPLSFSRRGSPPGGPPKRREKRERAEEGAFLSENALSLSHISFRELCPRLDFLSHFRDFDRRILFFRLAKAAARETERGAEEAAEWEPWVYNVTTGKRTRKKKRKKKADEKAKEAYSKGAQSPRARFFAKKKKTSWNSAY